MFICSNNIFSHFKKLTRQGKKIDDQATLVKELLQSFIISKQIIKEILLVWWYCLPSGRETFLQEKSRYYSLAISLHSDHSYRYVKCIGVQDGTRWICCYICLYMTNYENLLQIRIHSSVYSILALVMVNMLNGHMYICWYNI